MGYLSVFMYGFGIFIHIDLFMALGYFPFSFDCLPRKPAPGEESGMCEQKREQKINAPTAV